MGCIASSIDANDSNIFSAHFSIEKRLEHGGPGQLYRVKDRATKEKVIVKVDKVANMDEKVKSVNEQSMWGALGQHAHVVCLLESFMDNNVFIFVMEQFEPLPLLCNQADVRKKSREPRLFKVLYHALLGLRHCHSKGVCHRDVRPSSLFLGANGNVKLGSFGCAALVPQDGLYGSVGAAPYMSPEMLQGRQYGYKTDTWSCGVMAYLWFFGNYPYQDTKDTLVPSDLSEVVAPNYTCPCNFPHPSLSAENLVRALLEPDARRRPDANAALGIVHQRMKECNPYTAIQAEQDEDASFNIPAGDVHSSLKAWMQQVQTDEKKPLFAHSPSSPSTTASFDTSTESVRFTFDSVETYSRSRLGSENRPSFVKFSFDSAENFPRSGAGSEHRFSL